MIFLNPIIISQKIQQKDPYLKSKAFAASVSLHASLFAVALLFAASSQIINPAPEKRIVVSLAEYVSDFADPSKLEAASAPRPKPSAVRLPIPRTAPSADSATASSITTPEEISSPKPTHSPEASAPLARATPPASSPSEHAVDSPQTLSSSTERELPRNPAPDSDIGGAALGHIRAMIENAITYPSIARKLRLEGVVTVVFILKADGTVDAAKVQSTSGSRLLDTRAIDTILSLSGDYPALGKTVELSIPIAFTLKQS